MTIFEALRSQCLLFMIGLVHYLARLYFDRDYGSGARWDAATAVLICVLWFGIGTWARWYFQWPTLGILAKI